jgi:hypothetical protein
MVSGSHVSEAVKIRRESSQNKRKERKWKQNKEQCALLLRRIVLDNLPLFICIVCSDRDDWRIA